MGRSPPESSREKIRKQGQIVSQQIVVSFIRFLFLGESHT